MSAIATLYLIALAAIAGYAMIARVPSVLHLTLLSGANFVHGVVLCGAMIALAHADGVVERAIGFVAVALAAGNVVGGYLVSDRLLELFERRAARVARRDERVDERAPRVPASVSTPSDATTSESRTAEGADEGSA